MRVSGAAVLHQYNGDQDLEHPHCIYYGEITDRHKGIIRQRFALQSSYWFGCVFGPKGKTCFSSGVLGNAEGERFGSDVQ